MARPDRRTERTRKALMSAFVDVLLTDGYAAATVDAVVERANIGRSTFYTHYKGKEDMLRQSLAGPSSVLALIVGNDLPHEKLVLQLQHFYDQRGRNKIFFFGPVRAIWIRCLAGSIEPRLARLSRQARARPILPLPLAALQIAETQIGLVTNWLVLRPSTKPDAIAEALAACTRAVVAALLKLEPGVC